MAIYDWSQNFLSNRIIHVNNIRVLPLNVTIDDFFSSQRGLSIASLLGQWYDEASNMQGELNDMKSFISEENELLQLALTNTAKTQCENG